MKVRSRKKIWPLLMVLLIMIYAMGTMVYAAELPIPELDRAGSLSLTMKDPETEKTVPGGTVTLYRVANVSRENSADYSFTLTEDFSGSGETLTILDAALAERLAEYLSEEGNTGKITGISQSIDVNGRAVFENQMPGLFLIVQDKAAEGYYSINPFLVTLPMEEDGSYIYDVEAEPKMELLTKIPPGNDTPGEKTTPGGTIPSKTVSDTLSGNGPKTGDSADPLFWILALAGSLSVSMIIAMVYRCSKKEVKAGE